jgi:hypothetical protein
MRRARSGLSQPAWSSKANDSRFVSGSPK